MRCSRCQHENPPRAKFCEECATPFTRTCANCGTSLSATAKFCPECAHPAGTATVVEPRFAAPEAYTPKHLAEKILTSKSALEGERKQVTVLFADLKGSMELLADRDPEEARRILDPVLEHMMEAVHRYEGTVNQVMGDGIMALFGAPLAQEDHAVRACYAALAMQSAIRSYTEEVRRAHGIEVQIRIGLNSGEVVVRAIGSDLRMDYTAVGQTTHLAARMEQLAAPGSVRLTADTLRLAEGFIQVASLGPVPVKGLPGPVEVFELLGAGTRTRMQAVAARGLTRFVGRDAELDSLRQALQQASAGHGQVAALVGEPGVGKSRLFWEFTHSHRTQRWLILESGSVSYGKATAYLPVIDLLKAYFQIEARDDGRKIREKVTGKLLTLDEALKPTLPALLSLLDVPVEDPGWQALDPPQRRQRTLDAVKRLLLRESQVQPLCLVFEDLHWIDTETQALLDSLVESLPTARVLLLVNYRPEYEHHWGRKTYYTQLRIDPLPPESAGELLHALLGAGAGLEPLKHLLLQRTEGNPFFLEESVRTLVETGVLAGERGAYQLTRALAGVQVPATVQAVLGARIDRLPPEEKTLLQTAAVIGKDVPFALLQAIADLPDEQLRRGLAHLQAAEFLYEATLFPELEYTFKHALTHDVAYGSLLHERRRALHARIVEAVETLSADRLAEQVDRLAHHAVRGELRGKAVVYLHRVGVRAMTHSAAREALTCFEQALSALGHLPESREWLEQAFDIRYIARNAILMLGELEGILPHLHEAERVATLLEDQRRLGWVWAALANYLWQTGASAEARARAEKARAIGEALGDVLVEALGSLNLGFVYQTSGDIQKAEESFAWIVESIRGDLIRDRSRFTGFLVPMSHAYLGWLLAERGEFARAIAEEEEGLRLAEALDQPYTRSYVGFGFGLLRLVKGDVERAIHLLERALAICGEWNIGFMTPFVTWALGHAYALAGRGAEGLALLAEALATYEAKGFRAYRTLMLVHLAEACLLADRVEEARSYGERALVRSRERAERSYEAYALRLLGEVAARRDPPDADAAEDHYRRAMARAEELGMRPLAAHCHLGLGKLYQRTGRQKQAQEHLGTATTMYREMDMGFWQEKAEAELRAL